MDTPDDFGLGEREQIIVPLKIALVIREPFTAKIRLLQLVPLHHGSHCPIQKKDALSQLLAQFVHENRVLHATET